MRKIKLSILIIIAVCSVQSAVAWSGFGHCCIVYIAEQHLTPEAKKKCHYYLRHSLPYYAGWMDSWRGAEAYKSVNNPHSGLATSDGKTMLIDRGGKPKGRVMGHLRLALAELGDGKYKNLPDSVVRQRIINMVHYVGDMHCPSHVKFQKKTFPQYVYTKGVTRNGKVASYHGFWDGSPGTGRYKWTMEEYAAAVDNVSRKQAKAWQSGSLEDWGRDIARGGHRGRELLPDGTDISKMTKEQKAEAIALADEMVLIAAYRLAHVLNTIFADGNIPITNKK